MAVIRVRRRWLIGLACLFLVAFGVIAAEWRMHQVDAEMRRQMVRQATQIAATISPDLVRLLSFSVDDRGQPAFEVIRAQLIAHGHYIHQRSIYSTAIRDGVIVFGPENLAEGDPYASPPGTVYQNPASIHWVAFQSGQPQVAGPYTDEYGTFVTALAPILDPRSHEVLMVVGLDVPADEWAGRLAGTRLVPLLGTLIPALVLAGASAWVWRRMRRLSAQRSWPRYLDVATVVVVGLPLTLIATLLSVDGEQRERRLVFEQLAQSQVSVVRDTLFTLRDDLVAIERFFRGSQMVTRQEFASFVEPMVRSSTVQAFEWLPVVRSADRSTFEQAARREGLTDFVIFERDAAGQRMPAAARDVYYPIYYVEPLAGNKPVLGYDPGSEPVRRTALERAAATGLATASDPLTLVQEPGQEKSVVVFHPVLIAGRAKHTRLGDPAAAELTGFAVGVVRLQSSLAGALTSRADAAPDVTVSLVDVMPEGEPTLLAAFPENRAGDSAVAPNLPTGPMPELASIHPLFVFGRAWAVVVYPGGEFFVAHSRPLGWLTGVSGLLITTILAAFVAALRRRETSLEQVVDDRTAALRESEEKYRLLVENAGEAVYVVQQGRLVFANPACEAMTATPVSELEGMSIAHLLPEDQRARILDQHQRLIDGGVTQDRIEATLRMRDGRERVLDINAVAIRWNGQPATLNVATDVTDRRHAEAERLEMERRLLHAQKLESLGVLSGGIAHDFNNLLTAILGNLELALDDRQPLAYVRARIEAAARAAHRAADLTRQMLAYSGKGQFVIQDIDLSQLVRENAQMLEAAVSRNVAFALNLAADLPPIRADAGQIQQVIMNLITNASEAIGDHAGTVSLTTGAQHCDDGCLCRSRLEQKPAAGEFVFLEVSDTGSGMDEQVMQRLFDPFFTTKFTGRGLGMSAVLGIVRGHQGAITVDSEPGRGTIVRVLFPVHGHGAPVHARIEALASDQPASSGAAACSGTLLVVDDDEMVRGVVQSAVRSMGFDVLLACDGAEAISLYRAHADRIAGVILDLTMPNMDGVATFSELRRIRPDVKVILSSGYGEQEATRRFAGLRLDGFVQKPYRLQELEAMVRHVLKEKGV